MCKLQAMQKLNEVREKVNATNEAFVAARKRAHKAKLAFEKVIPIFFEVHLSLKRL